MDIEGAIHYMLHNVTSLRGLYTFLVEDLADGRTRDLPLLHNPIWITLCIGVYLLLVLRVVPEFMQDRKALQLKYIIIVYDIFQMLGSGVSIYLFYRHGWTFQYFYKCKAPDFSYDADSVGFVYAAYFTFLLKMSELIETVMYALRKKNAQISRFHVYHHCYALVTSWGFAKYGGGSMLSYTIIVNSIVHIFMYAYYLSSIFAKQIPFSLVPVKKFITLLQITQLITVLINLGFAMRPDCPVPAGHCLFHGPNMALQIKLFADFYLKTYTSKKLTKENQALSNEVVVNVSNNTYKRK
ncbi:elongation of very long chain fatty acids protein 4-like [Armigeres subalbatus]|uniref:elongation of very long chain fatty acids protein 4-like n=1 Tax=Armigeres subalbatus TaxID=124917 RepID=UPI002ED43F64